jgi:hypothetical protein
MRDRPCTLVHLAIVFGARHNSSMARPGRKPKTLDMTQLAARITEIAMGEIAPSSAPEKAEPAKDPAAVALGRKGGSAEKGTRVDIGFYT